MKKYSFILYKKEGTKQKLSCNNYATFREAKEDLDKTLDTLGLKKENADKYEESEDNIFLVFENIVLKICPYFI